MDRRGRDFESRIAASAAACAALCQANARCQSFTYVLPNTIQGPHGICWLKAAIPRGYAHACCVSGVKLEDAQLPDGDVKLEDP